MVVDTSAILAMLFGEPERDAFISLLADAEDPLISAATLLESSIVMSARTGEDGVVDLDGLLAAAGVRCVAVDSTQAYVAREAFGRFGKRRVSAGLNFGDCFSYALARVTGRPLLFKGDGFRQTGVTPAHT
jgi:ribonuclease VapC